MLGSKEAKRKYVISCINNQQPLDVSAASLIVRLLIFTVFHKRTPFSCQRFFQRNRRYAREITSDDACDGATATQPEQVTTTAISNASMNRLLPSWISHRIIERAFHRGQEIRSPRLSEETSSKSTALASSTSPRCLRRVLHKRLFSSSVQSVCCAVSIMLQRFNRLFFPTTRFE